MPRQVQVLTFTAVACLVLVIAEIANKVIVRPDDLPWRIFEADAVSVADGRNSDDTQMSIVKVVRAC
ncbi:MAG: hypothetical protein J2P54_22140 [Bradyrhizobiaceae bacterium]|nr:hypothetical protein [Bradyrhizobiaceae bacterium]